MGEYTYKNLIIDPTSEEAKTCIGKRVYYSSNPASCLQYANDHDMECCKVLKGINPEDIYPFVLKDNNIFCSCIILCEEEPEPKYVPFESPQEFISAYNKASKEVMSDTESMLLNSGMWLKWQDHYVGITYISKQGVNYGVEFLDWDELLDEYTFLDGSPVGKEANGEATLHEKKMQDDLPIGTRFLDGGQLVEVVDGHRCGDCVFAEIDCSQKRCVSEERSDKKNVYFKEVKGE